MKKERRAGSRGQGLAEYALLLVLVALVAAVSTFAVGLAVQRVYGVLVAAFGVKHNAVGQIEITQALCDASQSQNTTGLWVIGTTSEDVTNLTGSTEMAVGTGLGGAPSPVTDNGAAGTFKFNPQLGSGLNLSLCPKAVVIQARDGAIAVSPVMAEIGP